MTPQESQLVTDLFDRLARLESAPRNAAAEQLIADGLQRAPHAIYTLVQTALVQDEALKRASVRIEELEAQMPSAETEEQQPASFLNTMRDVVTGRAGARGSVPSVRTSVPGLQPRDILSPESQSQNARPQGGQLRSELPPQPAPEYPNSAPFSSGGSFLGNAASTAAGVIGGSLLLNSIRSMFGQRPGSQQTSRGVVDDSASSWNNKADARGAASDRARGIGAEKPSDERQDTQYEQRGGVEDGADAGDEYDRDDSNEPSEDDFDDDDWGSDSYDL
jgi:uncharacterized protein